MLDINFSLPYWLSVYFHIIGSISLIADIFSIYLILFKSEKIDNFRYFLLNFRISCILTDFHLTFLIQPVPFYPILAGSIMGFGIRLGATLHFGITGFAFLLTYQIGSMIICFVRKHQTIAKTLQQYRIPRWGLILMMTYFLTFTMGVTGFLSVLSVPEDLKFDFVEMNYPDLLPQFQKLPNFSIYEFSSKFLALIIFSILGGFLSFTVFILVLVNILRMLTILKLKISSSNYQKHRAAIRSLSAQFVTSAVIFVPPIVCVVVIMVGLNGSQLIVEVFLMVACLHSTLNVIVLIVTCPPYRRFLIQLVQRKNSPKSKGARSVLVRNSAIAISNFNK
ncbi:Serpentine Receptor, class H [Caenorhabditis elegans]|uniref:Serpentine Receptor, class H n=1 Tax=Caenorhabditis elegans TaxID=6239 RepID=Q9TZF0_CAEEL|nr:Serpentine Receptor, class H [Caenorhabditis elegans]CCD73599.1 Serpentine Receptor, class H [Caenorhabditis elegans]|eukprot:NP_494456.2 Serpentine Receptor, class I [Caenorhabditis elegans]